MSAVHRESIVVDSMSNGPFFFTEAMRDGASRKLAGGTPALDVLMDARDEFVREIGTNEAVRRRYIAAWDAAGVTCVSATQGELANPPFTFESGLAHIARTTRLIDGLRDHLVKVTRAEDIRSAHRHGKHGILLNFQNTTHFGLDWSALELFYNLGIRIIQLTYNTRNFVGDGCTERTDAGLSRFGIELVRRLNDMGVLVDVSHCGRRTALDAVHTSTKPVALTHTFAAAVSKHDRAADDEVLKAVADTGGYIGVVAVPFFISARPDVTLNAVVDHLEHIIEVCGVDHVGIATDWGMDLPRELTEKMNLEMGTIGFRSEHRVDWNRRMPDYQTWVDWPNITQRILDRGHAPADVAKILGLNFLRIFEAAVG